MKKKTIWISYDLGVRGDYDGLYSWLDEHDAEERGDSVALIKYDFSGDLIDALKADIGESVETTKKSRFYVIWHDTTKKKMKGRFLFGTKKSPPWSGYAVGKGSPVDDEA